MVDFTRISKRELAQYLRENDIASSNRAEENESDAYSLELMTGERVAAPRVSTTATRPFNDPSFRLNQAGGETGSQRLPDVDLSDAPEASMALAKLIPENRKHRK
jgi:hypothetical protein